MDSINQTKGEQNELLNYYKNKHDSANDNENEKLQENNNIINSIKNEKEDLIIGSDKQIEEDDNSGKNEKNEENKDININETEQNQEYQIKYVNIERDDLNEKNEEQNILNNRMDDMQHKEENISEDEQNIEKAQKIHDNINININSIDQTENEVAENIDNNLNQNNLNESSKNNALETGHIEQKANINNDLEEEHQKDLNNVQCHVEDANIEEINILNKNDVDEEQNVEQKEILNSEDKIDNEDKADNVDNNNLEKENENDIENKNDKKVDDFNYEDEEIKAIHQKIDKKLNEIEMNLLQDYENENYNNNADLNINKDNDIQNNNKEEGEEEEEEEEKEEGNQENKNKKKKLSNNDEKEGNSIEEALGSKESAEDHLISIPQSNDLLFNPNRGRAKSIQPLFSKYDKLQFQKRFERLSASIQPGEAIYQRAKEIFPSKYGIEMPYRSQLRQSNYSINNMKSSNKKRLTSEKRSGEIKPFDEFRIRGSSSGSLWNSSIGIKKYGKKNYYKYKNKKRSDNPFVGLSIYDKSTKKRKSLIAQTIKKESNEFDEIILIEGNVIKKRELDEKELTKIIDKLGKFLYEDEEKNLENKESYEYKINKVSNMIKVMDEDKQLIVLEQLENKANDEYSKELFEKLKTKIEDYKEKIVKYYKVEKSMEDELDRYRFSSSRQQFKKSIK